MCGVVFYAADAFMRCVVVGPLINVTAQITLAEGLVEIVIAITAIPIATLVDPTTVVITAIVAIVSSIIIPVVAVVVIPVVAAVIVPTTIMTTVSALTVV